MKNFTNGSLVFRLWSFDGSGETVAKFQYFSDAKTFAEAKASEDREKQPDHAKGYFYLAVCEAENEMKAFFPIKPVRAEQ